MQSVMSISGGLDMSSKSRLGCGFWWVKRAACLLMWMSMSDDRSGSSPSGSSSSDGVSKEAISDSVAPSDEEDEDEDE